MTDAKAPAVRVQDVVMEFRLVHERNDTLKEAIVRRLQGKGSGHVEQFRALDGVSFDVSPGESIGIIGHNGSGKTTLLRLLAGVLTPTHGSVDIRGRVSTLIELGAGFNPDLSGAENIFLAGALYGFGRREMAEKFDRIVEFSELDRFIEVPVKNYSSGMSARLGFSIATDVDPDVLVVDEVLAVGDQAFQDKCMERMQSFRERGKTIVLVSHDLDGVREFCSRGVLLDHGKIIARGTGPEVVEHYLRNSAAE
ncbi:MAG: ABC transporter ATP-binding protein [Gemmatimonadetes bacterium]|nr:ABC transporter ATP-binding protein [Gemmatimonadota bacterium]